ncbi:hypothetical protein, partial [Mesorhizobium sp. M0228]|uniref:hypothetical protein n=1 Tax=Mesorhizobium sp. M0228 TaxID=2956923 RepID=UPI00333DDCFF
MTVMSFSASILPTIKASCATPRMQPPLAVRIAEATLTIASFRRRYVTHAGLIPLMLAQCADDLLLYSVSSSQGVTFDAGSLLLFAVGT